MANSYEHYLLPFELATLYYIIYIITYIIYITLYFTVEVNALIQKAFLFLRKQRH